MSKKAEKRRHKRRQQHQAGRDARSQEVRRFVDERVAAASAAVGELVEAAKDVKVPPAAVAAMVADAMAGDFLVRRILTADDMVVPIAEEVVEDAGSERARAVAVALEERLDVRVELAWPALALAEESEDLESAGRIAERALERMVAAAGGDGDEEDGAGGDDADGDDVGGDGAGGDGSDGPAARMAAELAAIRWRQGRLGEALEGIEGWCVRRPDHPDVQHMQAVLVVRAAGLQDPDPGVAAIFSEGVDDDQRDAAAAALARFHDRSVLYRLRDRVEAFIAADPVLSARRDRYIAEFVEEVRQSADLGPLDDPDPSMLDLAAERFWLAGDPDDDEGDDAPDGEQSALGLFAAHPDSPADLAAAARDWLGHVRYGLWLADWFPADRLRGRWMTDIVTRRRVYACIPPEQLEGVARWAVLAGAVAPVAGVWRMGQALVAMDPDLADEVAESVIAVSEAVAFEMAREQGIKVPRPRSRARRRPDAHGVLSEVLEPMDRFEAELISHVMGNSLSHLVAMVESDRRRVPAMSNTDGEPVELISAIFPVAEPDLLRRRLIGDMDFEGDDGTGSEVTVRWLGRAMTAEESAGALAQFRAAHPTAKIEDADGPQRWMRGTVHFERGQVRVEVNSRARLDAVAAKLRKLGAGEPTISRRIDPAMDFPSSGGRPQLGRSLGAEADAAWAAQWVQEKVPALDGARPADAARDPRRIALLERLLRQFEHDADVVAASGETPMDVEGLRERLGMQDGILDVYDVD